MTAPAPLPPPDSFLSAAAQAGIEFEPGDLEALGAYLALLLDETTRINLTAVRDPDEAWTTLILDSLTLLSVLAELGDAPAVADVGSGAGLPGIPLAIALPRSRVTLIEATAKKADFLRRAAAQLKLTNVEVVNQRAERAGEHRSPLRETFDAATARAVGHLATVAELTLPLVRVGGLVLAVKGEKAEQELAESAKALSVLGADPGAVVTTPTGRIVVLRKNRPTQPAYPRRDGEPKRRPIGLRAPRSA